MSNLDGYKITLTKNRLLGTWNWKVDAPDGVILSPISPLGFAKRENAEADALRAIEADAVTETLSGPELRERVLARSGTQS